MPKILVTGASGFIGSWCVIDLLQQGYEVRGTLRDLDRAASLKRTIAQQLGEVHSAELIDRLEFCQASLTDGRGWQEAIAGTDAVFHVASPVPIVRPADPQEVIKPAVDGTLNVLNSAQAVGVSRIVMTSSVAAVSGNSVGLDRRFDATHWSDTGSGDLSPYAASKTLAEKAAWEFCEQHPEMELTTINPALVLGPAVEADYGSSLETLVKLLKGQLPLVPRLGFEIVDVRDVAALHRLALAQSAINQRLLCAAGFRWFIDISKNLAAQLDAETDAEHRRKLPKRELPDFLVRFAALFVKELGDFLPNIGKTTHYDTAPALALGWQPRSPEEAALAGAKSLIALGLV